MRGKQAPTPRRVSSQASLHSGLKRQTQNWPMLQTIPSIHAASLHPCSVQPLLGIIQVQQQGGHWRSENGLTAESPFRDLALHSKVCSFTLSDLLACRKWEEKKQINHSLPPLQHALALPLDSEGLVSDVQAIAADNSECRTNTGETHTHNHDASVRLRAEKQLFVIAFLCKRLPMTCGSHW